MEEIIVISNEFVKVTYDENIKLMQIFWKKNAIPSSKFQEFFSYLLEVYDKDEVLLLLIDLSELDDFLPIARRWLFEIAKPKAIQKGLKKSAFVIKSERIKKYFTIAVIKIVNMNPIHKMDVFSTVKEALNWLKKP